MLWFNSDIQIKNERSTMTSDIDRQEEYKKKVMYAFSRFQWHSSSQELIKQNQ